MTTPLPGSTRLVRLGTALCLALFLGAVPGHSQAVRLDPSFAPTIVSARTAPGRFAGQPDGRILVFGASTLNGTPVPDLARLLPDGTRDPSFAGYNPPVEYGSLVDLNVAADGRIILSFLVANDVTEPNRLRSTIVRLLANGAVDPTFHFVAPGRQIVWTRPAPDGTLVFASYDRGSLTKLDATGAIDVSFQPDLEPEFAALNLLVQSDGKILIFGTTSRSVAGTGVLRRLLASGRSDPAFAPATVARGGGNALALQPDGKILLLTDTLLRYGPDGKFDRSVYTPFRSYSSLILTADGRIVLSRPYGTSGNSIVLKADGTTDLEFTGPFSCGVTYAIETALPDGRFIAVLDDATSPYGLLWTTHSVICLRADGAVDPTFAGQLGYPGTVYSVLPESDGTIMIAGAFDHVNGQPRAGVARLRSDGALDPAFVPPSRSDAFQSEAIIPFPDGYLIRDIIGWQAAGWPRQARYTRLTRSGAMTSWQMDAFLRGSDELPGVEKTDSIVVPKLEHLPDQQASRWVLRRYTPDSAVPTTVAIIPSGPTPYSGSEGSLMQVIPLEDGTLRLRGNFTEVNGAPRYGLARITATGALADPTLPESAPLFDDPTNEFISQSTYDHGRQEMKLVRLLEDGSVDPSFTTDRDYSMLWYPLQATSRDAAGRVLFRGPIGLFRLSASGVYDPNVQVPYAEGAAIMARDGTIYVSQLRRELARYVPVEEAVVTRQPANVTTVIGRKVQFDVGVGLSAPVFYQWYHDGIAIPGATNATLTLPEATMAMAGRYQAVAYANRQVLQSETVTLTANASDGRYTNFSARSWCGEADARQIVGFTLVGAVDTPVLLRAIGPGLAPFGVSDPLDDPRLVVIDRWNASIAENDDWGGTDALRAAFLRLGAFGLDAGSTDAALYRALAPGGYTTQITGTTPGTALFELYTDTGPGDMPLQNFSVRTLLGSGDRMPILGFSISGSGPRKVLLRAVGPSLGLFGIIGAANPRLELFGSTGLERVRAIASVEPAAIDVARRVGAFALAPGAKDTAMVVTLEPGSYTAQVTGTDSRLVLIEVYDVPL